MNNIPRIAVPNSFNFKQHRVPLAHPLMMLEQGAIPTLHAVGGMTPLEVMTCHCHDPGSTPQEVVGRAKELLDECARVQGDGV